MFKKRSFFDRLTGGIRMNDHEPELELEQEEEVEEQPKKMRSISPRHIQKEQKEKDTWPVEEEEGQLTVDVYQTPGEIIIQTMVAGVRPEDLSINITRDMITIKGKREENRNINEDNYFTKELYWGSFSRTILLPQEIEVEDAEATEKHGLLMIRLPKIDKERKTSIKIKSL